MRPHTEFFKQGVTDLRRILKGSLRVVDVAEKLDSYRSGKSAEEARAEMKERTFDVMGYEVDGDVEGYVCVEDLTSGTCEAHKKPLEPSDMIGTHAPILEMLSRLKNRRWLFMAVNGDVKGIVTLADLQKAPVRMALFGLVSLLEIHSISMVKTVCPSQVDIQRGLTRHGLWKAAKENYERMQGRREDIDLATSLTLPAKTHLVCDSPDVPKYLGFCNVGHARKVFSQATDLRNNLAHGRDIVEGTSWPEAIEVVEKIEQVLDCYETNREAFKRRFGADRKKP